MIVFFDNKMRQHFDAKILSENNKHQQAGEMDFTQGYTKSFVMPSSSRTRRESQQLINTWNTRLCNNRMELRL